jgi:hypothetical protein
VGDEGAYKAHFQARGVLQVTPVDPRTGAATGPSFEAHIAESHDSSLTDGKGRAEHLVRQYLLADPLQAFFESMEIGSRDRFVQHADCGS